MCNRALGDGQHRLKHAAAPSDLLQAPESPSEKANLREDPCSLGTAIPYHEQPLQAGQNAAVVLGPQKVLAKMLNCRSSFMAVRHLFASCSKRLRP